VPSVSAQLPLPSQEIYAGPTRRASGAPVFVRASTCWRVSTALTGSSKSRFKVAVKSEVVLSGTVTERICSFVSKVRSLPSWGGRVAATAMIRHAVIRRSCMVNRPASFPDLEG